MLTDVLPARYRKGFYALYALVGVVLGAIQVAYLNIAGQPVWLTVALAVFGFVGTAFGATAASNITRPGVTDDDLARLSALFDQRTAAAAAVRESAAREVYPGDVPAAAPGKAPTKKPAKKAAPKKPTG